MFKIDSDVAGPEILVGVHDHLEAMPVQAPALVAWRHIRQSMSRLEPKASPYVHMVAGIHIYAFVRSALDTHAAHARNVDARMNPSSQILVRWMFDEAIQIFVVERADAGRESIAQLPDLAAWEGRPAGRELDAQLGDEAMSM